jgi:translation initiation factor 1 (eIF-1/SUI1)
MRTPPMRASHAWPHARRRPARALRAAASCPPPLKPPHPRPLPSPKPQVIQLQGDQRKNVHQFLTQEGLVKPNKIKLHGF